MAGAAITRPSGHPVRVTHPVPVAAARVWDLIAAPGHLERCHPFCARNPVTSWPGPAAVDRVEYLSGWVWERRIVHWIDGVGYDLEIGAPGEEVSFVSWRIEPQGSTACSITITVHPRRITAAPIGSRRLVQLVYVRPLLRRYLISVVRGVEWCAVRDEPVPRDRFGRHPWFSAPR